MAGRGFAVMTFDFRGCGSSDGAPDRYPLILDLRAAIDQLHKRDYQTIACIGASMGGSACLRAAADGELIGVGIIASLMSTGEPTNTTPEELAKLTIPKLFLYTENDDPLTEAIIKMYEITPEPKRLHLFPGATHGIKMFGEPFADQFTAELVCFLENLR